ncbi:hypothetical protein [Leptospira koniambonensis]|uniref:hypothetical protein n=1 Tax=Leptospira koniambonensis TaxID=2484950 RepID=UPI003EB9CCB1
MKATTPRIPPKGGKVRKRTIIPSGRIKGNNAFENASEKENYVILSQAQYKNIIKQLEELRLLVEEIKEEKEPTKEEILAGIAQGYKEAKLIRAGKLKTKSMQQLIDEL